MNKDLPVVPDSYQGSSKDCLAAITLATEALPSLVAEAEQYKLIAVENLLASYPEHVWRLRFKLRKLIPDESEHGVLGAGGELFVQVNISKKTVEVTGYGE